MKALLSHFTWYSSPIVLACNQRCLCKPNPTLCSYRSPWWDLCFTFQLNSRSCWSFTNLAHHCFGSSSKVSCLSNLTARGVFWAVSIALFTLYGFQLSFRPRNTFCAIYCYFVKFYQTFHLYPPVLSIFVLALSFGYSLGSFLRNIPCYLLI